jgi:hypothetical protein
VVVVVHFLFFYQNSTKATTRGRLELSSQVLGIEKLSSRYSAAALYTLGRAAKFCLFYLPVLREL